MSKGDWLDQPERSTPAMLRTIRWIALRVGRRPARVLLYPITLYFLVFAPAARRHSRAFLRRAQRRRPGMIRVARHFHAFASVILDRVFLLSRQFHLLDVTVNQSELLDDLLESRRGGLLLGAHFGSFEVLRALAVAREGYPVRVLMYRDHNALITRLLDELDPDVAETVIDLADPNALLKTREALEAGELVGMLADRSVGDDEAVVCPFLGKPAEFPAGPMRLAAVLGVPVISFVGVYQGGNRYAIHFRELTSGVRVPHSGRRKWVEEMTALYAANLEEHARHNPFNWFNFYDFWKRREV